MKNEALRGKPNAGNPHVRFDEGEVAPCTAVGRVLAFCSASLLLALSAQAGFTDTSDIVLHFPMDEIGAKPLVHDSSGNGWLGYSTNNVNVTPVYGGTLSNSKCFSNFINTESQVLCTNVVSDWGTNWSFVCWVRNPNMAGNTKNHFIARGAACPTNAVQFPVQSQRYDGRWWNNAWEVWITTNGAMSVGMQSWNGTATNAVGSVLDWEADVWYQVAVVGSYQYTYSAEKRYRKIVVYVTKAGGESIGEPAVELELDTQHGYGGDGKDTTKHLVIGGAPAGTYTAGMPGGFFDGDIRDAWLFLRTLTPEDLLSDVRSFVPSWHDTKDFAKFYWELNETGETPVAVDATGNGFNGVSLHGVVGGLPAPVGTCYGGFGNDAFNCLYAELDGNWCFSASNRNEIVMWVKQPSPASSTNALLACSVDSVADTAIGKNQSWRVDVVESGAVRILVRDWENHVDSAVGQPYDWGKKWNLVSIKFDRPKRDNMRRVTIDGDLVTTNYQAGVCNRIRVYVAKAARYRCEEDFQLLAECETTERNIGLANHKYVVFGHSGPSWQPQFKPDSILGEKGCLGEIAFKTGGWFDFDYLKTQQSRYYEGGPLIVIFR